MFRDILDFIAGETDDVANSVAAYAEWFGAFISLPQDPLPKRVGSEEVCTSATAQSQWPLETFRCKLLGLQTHGALLESAAMKFLANLKMAPAIASTILDHKEYASAQLRELAAAARSFQQIDDTAENIEQGKYQSGIHELTEFVQSAHEDIESNAALWADRPGYCRLTNWRKLLSEWQV